MGPASTSHANTDTDLRNTVQLRRTDEHISPYLSGVNRGPTEGRGKSNTETRINQSHTAQRDPG